MTKRFVLFAAAFLVFVSPVAAQERQDARRDAVGEKISVGLSAYAKGDFAAAVTFYNQLLHDSPTFAHALLNRGRAYAALKQFPKAERDFTAYSRLSPYTMDGYLERGRIRRAQGRLKNALQDFSSVIDCRVPYGGGVFSTARPSLVAEAQLERAVTHYQIGASNEMSGRGRSAAYEAALADFDMALAMRVELTPNAVFDRAFIAEAWAADPLATPNDLMVARYEAAATGYDAFLRFVPKTPDARAVREHVNQIYAWLSGDKTAPRPTAPPMFVLKPIP